MDTVIRVSRQQGRILFWGSLLIAAVFAAGALLLWRQHRGVEAATIVLIGVPFWVAFGLWRRSQAGRVRLVLTDTHWHVPEATKQPVPWSAVQRVVFGVQYYPGQPDKPFASFETDDLSPYGRRLPWFDVRQLGLRRIQIGTEDLDLTVEGLIRALRRHSPTLVIEHRKGQRHRHT